MKLSKHLIDSIQRSIAFSSYWSGDFDILILTFKICFRSLNEYHSTEWNKNFEIVKLTDYLYIRYDTKYDLPELITKI